MKCKSCLDNNYEIIGLCDLKEIESKINKFNSKSWNEFIMQNKLTIEESKPNIKCVTKAYVEVEITSTKIINTSFFDNPNTEGLELTGKLLLVSGNLCENIIYVSDNFNNSMHSVKFNHFFTANIVIDENADLENTDYCVFPCIEDVSLKPLDSRTISQTANIFLFAHTLKEFININNEFIFYDYPPNSKTEIVRVGFDDNANNLIATSTGNNYQPRDAAQYLGFELIDSKTNRSKASGTVPQNQNGSDFVRALNNQSFEIGDLIDITYQRGKNVSLTNYPKKRATYSMDFLNLDTFKITKQGIVPYVLPNVIILKSSQSSEIFRLGFDIYRRAFLTILVSNDVANITQPSTEYLKIIVKNSNLTEKLRASINGNQTAQVLQDVLEGENFEFGDILELSYLDGSKVEITDKPYPTSSKQNLAGTTRKNYRITELGLVNI